MVTLILVKQIREQHVRYKVLTLQKIYVDQDVLSITFGVTCQTRCLVK